MKGKKWFILLASLALVLLANSMGVTRSSFVDLESSTGNAFQAWTSRQWTQTTQADFEAGVLNQVDTASSPGDVKLAEEDTQSVIASDDFESGGWSGGMGWLWGWWHEGNSDITTFGAPHGGSYHLKLKAADGYVDRAVNLSGRSNVRLQFWAKADSFEPGESAECYIYDGVGWNVVQTWVDGDDDNIYRFYDIDLSGFNMSSQFYVCFDTEMSDTDDYLYIDDLELVTTSSQPTVASDNFESGGWSGGMGWLWGWWHGGNSAITTSGAPHGGSYHLRLRAANGYVDRAVNLSGRSNVRLQFWAKADSFEPGEFAECYIYDGVGWNVVQTWVDGDDDNIYRFYDIDLSSFNMSSEFYIAFDAEMSGNNDYLYIDDLELVTTGTVTYYNSGTIASQVLDTGIAGDRWDALFWDEILESGTDITFEVRASDTLNGGFPDASWVPVGGDSPVTSGLPSGRYMQWRATLTTSDTSKTPTLQEVRVYHY